MAKKQTQQVEEDIDVSVGAKQNQNTFVVRWFNDYAVNSADELKIVCDLTARAAAEQFYIFVKSENTELFGVVFYATFMSILEFIKEKQKKFSNFTIEIAKSLNIGYTNNDDESNEKIGNFMPIMEYIGVNMNFIPDPDQTIEINQTARNAIAWKQMNSKKNEEYYKEIQERAFDKLKKEYKTDLRVSETIIPLFCIFLDNITRVLKLKYQEALGTNVSEVSMNVFGLFDIYYSFNEEDNLEIYEYQPNITIKLALKSDDIASRE